MTKKYSLKNLQDTRSFAKKIAKTLKGGEVLCLSGDLGSGKTTFTQFLAKELGVKENVTSPTFVLMKKYDLHPPKSSPLNPKSCLYHMDAYRLGSDAEALDLGLEEIWSDPAASSETSAKDGKNILVIEWADKIASVLPRNAIKIFFKSSEGKRTATIKTLNSKI